MDRRSHKSAKPDADHQGERQRDQRMQAHLQAETMRFVTNGVQLTTLNPHYIGLLGAAVVGINQIQ